MKLTDSGLVVRNPQASEILQIPVNLIVSIDGQQAQDNFAENVKLDLTWMDKATAHDGIAIICGSAPSLKRSYKDLKEGEIFALNGAAGFLTSHGIEVDYQVILDPNHFINDYFCPVKNYLLASTAPTLFFDRAGSRTKLWHPDIEWVADALESSDREFTYIGGGISVGVYCLNIAYAMGYREIHVYGVDSSYEVDSFYADGRANDPGFLPVTVEHNGQTYNTTYGMKDQVKAFQYCAKLLEAVGCVIKVHGSGLLPDVFNASDRAESHSTT